MRCPTCNATNPDSAEWCTQCFTSLKVDEPPPEPPPPAQPATPSTPAATDPAQATGAGEQVVRRGAGTFRKTEQGLDWQCGLCESWNPIEVQHCTTCGHSFADTISPPEERAGPDVDENVALIASAILPGVGHVLAGRTAAGVGRAVMYLLFLLGGWLLAREASQTGQTILPALPLLFGALILWVASLYDAVLAARGEERQLLAPRAFFWLVVGVLGLLMVTFAAAALSVSGSS